MSLEDLKSEFYFPAEKPAEVDLSIYPKWFNRHHINFMKKLINPGVKLILELGSWVGYSSRWFCNEYNTDLICVDHWKGSAEHDDRFTQQQLDDLYDAFILSCWNYKDQIIPLRMSSTKGMVKVYDEGLSKDVEVVYIDASHQYEDVLVDIEMAYYMFPNATLIGDDFIWKNPTQKMRRTVYEALEYFCNKIGIKYHTNKRVWGITRQ